LTLNWRCYEQEVLILYPYVTWTGDRHILDGRRGEECCDPVPRRADPPNRDVDLVVADVDLKVDLDVLNAATSCEPLCARPPAVDYVTLRRPPEKESW